jgi:hypothetical protein
MSESTPNPVKKKKSNNYIDNKKFYAEMIIYRRLYDESVAAGAPRPIVSRYIGECIMLIATRLATRPNFVGYSYKDEMISDGIENCLAYIHNFNPEKSTNPFAYFTQIIYYAFLRRIQKEKKQLYIKHKSFENSMIMNTLVDMAPEDKSHYSAAFINVSEKLGELVEKFEAKNPVASKAKKGVEKFIEDDDDET